MEPANKRRRSSESPENQNSCKNERSQATSDVHITRMPLELLAEILSYVPSTRDVLALARTSKHFCAVLVNNKATEFIWRRARATCAPRPIPDFTPNFTEASFAAFLFDSKTCEVCNTRTKGMYHSFALRACVCDTPKCLNSWRSQAVHRVTVRDTINYPRFLHWIPCMERTDGTYFEDQTYVRKEDWQQAVNEYKKVQLLGEEAMSAYVKEKQAIADRSPIMKEFYKMLINWSTSYETERKTIMRFNQAKAAVFASEQYWSLRDLLRTPTYSVLHNSKNRSLEYMTAHEFRAIKKTVAQEIAANKDRQALREKERAYKSRLDKVRSTLDEMKSKHEPAPALPNLNEFRKLPVVKIYETAPTGAETRTMKDPFVASVLAENLEQWREAARAALAAVLGFPGWKNLSRRKLHPVDRLTARFRCKCCDKAAVGKNVPDDGGMDFAQACEHTCPHLPKKRSSQSGWSAERFVPDQRAFDAISQVLLLCGTSAEDVDSVRVANELGDRVRCQSCSLVMDVASVGRHCKRHSSCSFALAETPAEPPMDHGLAKKLMSANAALQKVYGCRHCDHASATSKQPLPLRLLTFNGLRSHVKEKHLVGWIADEDFFRQKDTAAATSSAIDTAT